MLKHIIAITSLCCMTVSTVAIAEVYYYKDKGKPYYAVPNNRSASNYNNIDPNYAYPPPNYNNVDPNYAYPPPPNYNGDIVDPGFTHPYPYPPYPPYPPAAYPPPAPPAPPPVTENHFHVYPPYDNYNQPNYGNSYRQYSYEIYTKEGRAELVRDYPQYRNAVNRIESFELRLKTEQDRLRNLKKSNSSQERISNQKQKVEEIKRQINSEYMSLERELQRYGLLRPRPY